MIYPTAFEAAHERHWEDAEYLLAARRWANADQLYGFSAECGLKSAMLHLGMSVRADGSPLESEHRVHVRDLWSVFNQFATDRGASALLRLLPPDAPFSDWSVHNRYADGSHFSEAYLQPHRRGAWGVRLMVQSTAQGLTP